MGNYIVWNPNPIAFTIPFINHPITWYGTLFALGFFIGFYLLRFLFKKYGKQYTDWSDHLLEKKGLLFADKLVLYVVISTIIGARLGHILFYEKWENYLSQPLNIIKVWEGGLASHGGVIGILLGLLFFYYAISKDFPNLSRRRIIDLMVVPALLIATFIRIGNFINQEVLGVPTLLSWGIIFAHPIDGSIPIARHPAQLYEAAIYFALFIVFWIFFSKLLASIGRLGGLFFITTFSCRFLIEFVKEEQSHGLKHLWLNTGQWLSIPLICFGFFLLIPFHKGQKESIDLKV